MKHLTFAIIILSAVFGITRVEAKTDSAAQSYNMTRAMEELRNENTASASEYLTKEISKNPKNGYAHHLMALLHSGEEQYDQAMSSINLAIKYLPKKDINYLGRAYASRAELYAIAGDTITSLNDFNKALKINPDDADILETYGQMLYELKRYDDADKIYTRIVELNPTSVMGYMGLGRDAYAKGNYDDAIIQYNKVINMYDTYSSGYAFRAESYMKLGKYLNAIDDLLKAMSIDNDTKAYYLMMQLPEDQLTLVVTKLKSMAVKNPHEAKWQYYIGQLYHTHKMYRNAIEALQKAYSIDARSMILELIADCHSELGEYSQAIEVVTQAQQMDPDDLDLISAKADMLGESGDIDGAIAEWTRYIDKTPDFFGGYYRRGWFKDDAGRTDEALEDYNMSIMLNPDYAYAFLGKGDMLTRKGNTAEAMEAYRKVVELDTVPNNESCAMYAMLVLGEKDKAVDFMNRVIESDKDDKGVYYDAACFYSRIGDLNTALAHLRTAFEKGFRRFHHVMSDDDLEQLRAMPEFQPLLNEFQSKLQTETILSPVQAGVPERIEIPFIPDNGCASVKCVINDLPLTFIFDTGASIISISQVEANFMLKNGYLKPEDVIGKSRFVDANGDISEGTVINLREVKFGGIKLDNVRASVVRNQRAPLLLGQSVLGRLGSIEIDNEGKKLIIKSK